MFYSCSSLKILPDISIWNIDNVEKIDYLFGGCELLNSLPDISNWKINKVKSLKGLFYE